LVFRRNSEVGIALRGTAARSKRAHHLGMHLSGRDAFPRRTCFRTFDFLRDFVSEETRKLKYEFPAREYCDEESCRICVCVSFVLLCRLCRQYLVSVAERRPAAVGVEPDPPFAEERHTWRDGFHAVRAFPQQKLSTGKTGTGGSATISSAVWNDIQTAISSADYNDVTPGTVKLEGDFARTSGDATVGDLAITNANMALSGGWDSTFTAQIGRSDLNVNASGGDQYRVLRITGTNSTVTGCRMRNGYFSSGTGPGVYVSGNACVLQDLVVTNNIATSMYNSHGGGVVIGSADGVRVSRCTIVKNHVVRYGGAGKEADIYFQRSTLHEAHYSQNYGGTTTTSNAFAGALLMRNPGVHSRNDAGTSSQSMESNIEAEPVFVGSGADPFSISDASVNCANNGLAKDGGGFLYVDVNFNNAYNAMTDIVVDGSPGSGNHLVYTTDLSGNPRLSGVAIDRGAYEVVPPKPTVVLIW